MTRAQSARRHTRAKRAFLAAFVRTANVTAACREAGITRRRDVYDWCASDPDFQAAFEDAQQEGADELEAEARRRAVEGVEKPVYGRNGLLGHVQEYSDSLLALLLKAARPEKYRERSSVEHSGPGGGPIHQDVTLSDAALRAAEDAYLAAAGLAADLGVREGGDRPPDPGPHPV